MLISFEGVDGSGKSTQIQLLRGRLQLRGKSVTVVREPGGTPLSEQIREMLLSTDNAIAPFPELLLFAAARCQLVYEVIRPALAKGEIVVCDRFTDSTLAYQGGGRGVGTIEWLREFNLHVTGGLVPDRTYYLAIDPVAARLRSERFLDDRMESAGPGFFERVTEAYEQLAVDEPNRVVRLDGSRSPKAIGEEIWSDLSVQLERNPAGRPL